MNLLIDIGNTNLHWALQDGYGLGPMAVVRHDRALPIDLLAAWETLGRPDRVLAANVGGPAVAAALTRAVAALWALEPEFIVTRQDCLGLRVAYAEPPRLGVDRWLVLLAAAERVGGGGAALVLDLGSAATFDALAPGGRHLGGLILPGLTMMRDSLLAGTHIPQGALVAAPDPWATDTGAAVATASLHALAALAERQHRCLCNRLAETDPAASAPRLLVTGGDGPLVAPLIAGPLELVPDLVLRGLVRLLGAGAPTAPGNPDQSAS